MAAGSSERVDKELPWDAERDFSGGPISAGY